MQQGGGKSTVVAVIKRFYDPVEGRVLIDGTDLKQLNRAGYMKYVASVMQVRRVCMYACMHALIDDTDLEQLNRLHT